MKGVKGFQKGNQLGKKFDSEIQPENSGRPKGVMNRATIVKKWFETEIEFENPLTGLKSKISVEDALTLAKLKDALESPGGNSYKHLFDSRYGNPKQEVDMIGDIKITDHKLTIEVIAPKDEED